MANAFVTPEKVAQRAIAHLYENSVMLPLVYQDYSQEFSGAQGDTVNIRKPAVLNASLFDEATGIQLQDITEQSTPITLDKIADISVPVTSKQFTLDIESFERQVVVPAAKGLAQFIDLQLLAMRSQITQVVGTTTGREWDAPEVLIDADKTLNLANVPFGDRKAVIGPDARAHWLDNPIIKNADTSGSTAALREGSVGRNLFGFETFMTQNVGQPAATPASGQPTTEVGLAFHDSAFAFVSVPLELPDDNGWAAVETYEGLSVRTVKRYDITRKRTVISFDVLFGTKVLDPNRAVLLRGPLAA